MLALLILTTALLQAAPISTDDMLTSLVRDTYSEKVQLTAQQITDLLVEHYKQMEALNDRPKALRMTGERAGSLNMMTVGSVSGSNNVFINGDNNSVTNNNYYLQIGSNPTDLDHLITLIMNLTQQDKNDDEISQMVNDVVDVAREHILEEAETTEETFVSWTSTTELSTSAEMTTSEADQPVQSTTTTSTSKSTQKTSSTSSSTSMTVTTTQSTVYKSHTTTTLNESAASTTTTATPTTSTITTTTTSTTATTGVAETTSAPVESMPLNVQLKLPSSIDRRCPTCVSSKSVSACFKTQKACSSDQVCSIEMRSRNTRIESVTMGCKQRQSCHTENRQNDGQCRPWMKNGPSVCRTCCNGLACYATLQQFKNRSFRSAVSSWSKLF